MKKQLQYLKLFLPALLIITALSSPAQQEFTLTTTPANITSSRALIDLPGLSGNTLAIIVATPLGNTKALNPHPTGVWYYSGKWNLFNSNHNVLIPGLTYKVQYFLSLGPNQFLHLVTQENLGSEGSYIDNPALNNHPNVQFTIFQNHSPDVRSGSSLNRFEAKAGYSTAAGRWYITNIAGQPLYKGAAYNIVISNEGNAVTGPIKANPDIVIKDPKTIIKPKDTIPNITDPKIPPPPPPPPPALYGFVDMHTHPVSQLGFGEQLFYGDNDGDISTALGSCNCIHNFWVPPFAGSCMQQNLYRNQMVDKIDHENLINPAHSKSAGFPIFDQWPKYNSLLHQQMWIDWIKRAKEGGLRVMVALAVNNHTIADAAETGGVNDDLASMNKQLVRMKELFSRHDFLEIAYTSADLRRIVMAGKLAVILGIEMDNIGNFYDPADKKGAFYNPNPSENDIKYEIDRLFNLGVRYIFPIHITNNVFGGTALYSSDFNIANKYNTGSAFSQEVTDIFGGITFQLQHPYRPIRQSILGNMFMFVTGPILPPLIMPDYVNNYPIIHPPGPDKAHRNSLGLTQKGEMAVRYMMKKGMLIDIDHMSERSATAVLDMATSYNYPVNSGHSGFRKIPDDSKVANENGRTDLQVQKIYSLGGMMGLGHGGRSTIFVNNYRYGLTLSGGKPLAIGTDVNGFFPLPAPPMTYPYGPFNPLEMITYGSSLTKCVTGAKTWYFNNDGMAHYGLLPDFIESCRKVGMTTAEQNAFFLSAERFAQMWEKCDVSKINIQ